MRSLQDYRNIYAEIAKNNNITGDSVELLVQLLANASYISEVENISYVREASLEKATLINSKIQHCMNIMYSVFRGRCPRVILKFKPTKYHEFNVYDEIVTSNDFSIYYLGYLSESGESVVGTRGLPIEEGFVYGPCQVRPALDDSDTTTIIGLMSKEKVEGKWTTTKNNTYYVEKIDENLSSDMWVKIGSENSKEYYDTTRIFSEHILNHYIFDLTTTSYGSRLYIADILKSDGLNRDDEPTNNDENLGENNQNISILANYYKFSRVSEYKPAELKKINLSGSEMTAFTAEFLQSRSYEGKEVAPGVIIVPEVDREGANVIHYKANRDRFVSGIIRSNSDVGTVLEEMYPVKVMPYGTNYIFSSGELGSRVDLYYVPNNVLNLLTDDEISDFIDTKKSYYIVDDICVSAGRQFTAFFNLDVELYNSYTIDNDVSDILKNYEKKFNTNLSENIEEIKTLISKVSNIKQIRDLSIMYLDPEGNVVNDPDTELYDDGSIKPDIYFKIEFNINSIIQTRS